MNMYISIHTHISIHTYIAALCIQVTEKCWLIFVERTLFLFAPSFWDLQYNNIAKLDIKVIYTMELRASHTPKCIIVNIFIKENNIF